MKEFENTYEFWEKAQIGDTLKAGVIKKCSPLFEKVYICLKCKEEINSLKQVNCEILIKIDSDKFKCLKCNSEFTKKELGVNQNKPIDTLITTL